MANGPTDQMGGFDTAWIAGGLVFGAILLLVFLNMAGLTVNVGVRVG